MWFKLGVKISTSCMKCNKFAMQYLQFIWATYVKHKADIWPDVSCHSVLCVLQELQKHTNVLKSMHFFKTSTDYKLPFP